MQTRNKFDRKEWEKKYRKRILKKAETLVGSKCRMCGREKNLVFHRKDGKKHGDHNYMANWVMKEPKEWARVCHRCHTAIHWIMEFYGWTWEQIIQALQ